MIKVRSPLATMVEHPRDVTDRANVQTYGLCVHTTGSGVPTKAKEHGVDPMEIALNVYLAPDAPSRGVFTNFPHYVLGHDGVLIQIAEESERARHAAVESEDRAAYLSGAWRKKVSTVGLRLWEEKWPGFKSPSHLYPSKSPNEDYIGVELIPHLVPFPDGSRFSAEQYATLKALILDVEVRHNVRLRGPRLVGHEDIDPLDRWTSRGGYDPGSLQVKPSFYWARCL